MTDYTTLKDEELIPLIRAKDRLAEDELYARYKRVVKGKSHAYFLMGGDMEDIIQEGMIGLYKAVDSFDTQKNASFHGYADLCIKRQILSAIKMASRKKHSFLNDSLSLNETVSDDSDIPLLDGIPADSETDPEFVLLYSEKVKNLSSEISNSLSKMEQKVLSLYAKGYSYTHIAKLINKPEKSVDNALQRIKKKLLPIVSES